MARYIDVDALIAEYDRVHVGPAGGARKLMVDAPTADVAPKGEVALEAIDDFQNTLRHIFLAMCDGNDYNNLNLLQIDSAIEALFDSKIAELKKKYTGGGGVDA